MTGIAAHRSAAATMVHGTVLRCRPRRARACVAGPRRGDLDGFPRPAASRPDKWRSTGVDLEQVLLRAFGACSAVPSRREQELAPSGW